MEICLVFIYQHWEPSDFFCHCIWHLEKQHRRENRASESFSPLPICNSHISSTSNLGQYCAFSPPRWQLFQTIQFSTDTPPYLPLHLFSDLFDFPLVVLSKELQLFVNKTQAILPFLSCFQTVNSGESNPSPSKCQINAFLIYKYIWIPEIRQIFLVTKHARGQYMSFLLSNTLCSALHFKYSCSLTSLPEYKLIIYAINSTNLIVMQAPSISSHRCSWAATCTESMMRRTSSAICFALTVCCSNFVFTADWEIHSCRQKAAQD